VADFGNRPLTVRNCNRILTGPPVLFTGTHEALLDAANFIRLIEETQSLKIACLEEIGWRQGSLSREQFRALAARMANSGYRKYLEELIAAEAGH